MDIGENILQAICEGESLEDVDMLDAETVEEGELQEENQCIELAEGGEKDSKLVNQGSQSRSYKRKARRKKKKNKTGAAPNIVDINRFVIDTCRQLKERKSYLIWNAVGCLGISALSDLVKEVEAIRACGGQTTNDGTRPRTGGGILWNILKMREPKAYNEIMAKGKELEKQLKRQNVRKEPTKIKEAVSSERIVCAPSDRIEGQVVGGIQSTSQVQEEAEQFDAQRERTSVLSRIRVPVSYDDLLSENGKDQ